MSKRFGIGLTLGTVFAIAATPVTILPAIGVGLITGATTWAGGAIGKWGGALIGGTVGAAAGGALTKDAGGAATGGGALGLASYALGAVVGPIVGGVMGYSASVDHFTESAAQDSETSQIIQEASPAQIAYEKAENGNYILPAKNTLKLVA
jgi:hypothetical protein